MCTASAPFPQAPPPPPQLSLVHSGTAAGCAACRLVEQDQARHSKLPGCEGGGGAGAVAGLKVCLTVHPFCVVLGLLACAGGHRRGALTAG